MDRVVFHRDAAALCQTVVPTELEVFLSGSRDYLTHSLLCGACALFFYIIYTEFSLKFHEDMEVGGIWEELLTTSKLLCSTYLKIKGICPLNLTV